MTWSFLEKTVFLPSDGGVNFSPTDKNIILAAMQTAYDGSSIARTMFHNWIDAGNLIEIQFVPGDFFAYANRGKMGLDLSFLTDNTYIAPNGQAVEDTAVTAIVHELGHALTGRLDDNDNIVDYKGNNVIFVNTIYTQLGLPEQLSYIAYDVDGSLHDLNFQYTKGETIDRAFSGDRDWNSSAAGDSKDLLIGGASANILQAGNGNDFLWGAGGDDTFYGGAGIDTIGFKGKPTDYDLKQNSDGSWTSRHVRGAADEGNDTIINSEKVIFERGQTFDLKKKGLTYQIDFALVIDTTASMGDDIDAVKTQGNAIINALFADDTRDARIGIVGFKDAIDGEPTSIILPFTDQDQFADRKTAALTALNGISVEGGGDIPETPFDGLLNALNGTTMGKWRPGAGVHRIALFTDASAKDGSLAGRVAELAANIGATITSRSAVSSETFEINQFHLTLENSGESDSSGRELSTDLDASLTNPLPSFELTSESQTFDTSAANLEIYTIYTGDDGEIDSGLKSIAETTGGKSLTASTPEELVQTLVDIIELPPDTSSILDDPLYRFQNQDRPGTYLFAGVEERIIINRDFSPPFVEEGFAFNVSLEKQDGLIRFNRFQNKDVPGTYLYASESESESIRTSYPNFIEEGIAFYAFDAEANQGVDFYRFQNQAQPGTYIFVGEQEKNNILANYPQFVLEGVAFEANI